ncbi:hypothetical protein [Bradyrhizobium sp. CCBAU 51745]|uniref:hypothetical protein n=1 Tax=Bradyrhizobium sp. CCBAU 51745 TaxID=1325099 RepID=UPI002305D066|nr:hypothetical protein [Bradyrhizobium sp. CCBAU 51745]
MIHSLAEVGIFIEDPDPHVVSAIAKFAIKEAAHIKTSLMRCASLLKVGIDFFMFWQNGGRKTNSDLTISQQKANAMISLGRWSVKA